MKNKLILMVGISGSGKSHAAEKLAKREHAIMLSSDKIREELGLNPRSYEDNIATFNKLHELLTYHLSQSRNIIVEATNLTKRDRKCTLDVYRALKRSMGNALNYQVIAYVMDKPFDKCKEDNKNRERVVPDGVINRQISRYVKPEIEEGFDVIKYDSQDISNKRSTHRS